MTNSIEREHAEFVKRKAVDEREASREVEEKEENHATEKSQLTFNSPEDQLHGIFDDIDKNHSGRIEEKELKVQLWLTSSGGGFACLRYVAVL